jgi:Zn-dependent protease with chaperone function
MFKRLGYASPVVPVEVTSDGEILACAQGMVLPILNQPVGRITVDHAMLTCLDYEELEFVLAHEVSHIARSHYAETFAMAFGRASMDEAGKDDPAIKAALVVWDLFKVVRASEGELVGGAQVTLRHELEADAWAVWLTGDRAAAKRCLLRLCGNNLAAPSHTWEVFDKRIKLPVMTMGERLAALDRVQIG